LIIPVEDWDEWIVRWVLIVWLHPSNQFTAVVKPPTGLYNVFIVVASTLLCAPGWAVLKLAVANIQVNKMGKRWVGAKIYELEATQTFE